MSDELTYRDRNENYVPTPMRYSDSLHISRQALVGRPGGPFGQNAVQLALAQADELNRDPQSWWWAKVGDDPEHWSKFDGWDICIDVSIESFNYREVNSWKGRDEIRKESSWKLSFNGVIVAGGDTRSDILTTMLRIKQVSDGLQALPIDWMKDFDYRSQIEGRKVYYNSIPAQLGYWMPDQNCVMVHASEGFEFPLEAYDIEEQTDSDSNPEHSYSYESRHEKKVDLLDPHIWWWRKREFDENR